MTQDTVAGAPSGARSGSGPVIPIRGVERAFAAAAQAGSRLVLGPVDLDVDAGRVRHAHRPVGMRQVDAARIVADLVAPTAGTRRGQRQGAARGAPGPRLRDRVPVARPVRLADGDENVALPLEVLGVAARSGVAARRGAAGARRAHRVRGAPPVPAVGRDAAAGGDRPGALVRAADPAHGRAVRGAGRADPGADERRGAADLAADRDDGRVRDPLDPGGRLPLDPGAGDERPAGPVRADVTVDLPEPRGDATRESARFFELVNEVREALHAGFRAVAAPCQTGGRHERSDDCFDGWRMPCARVRRWHNRLRQTVATLEIWHQIRGIAGASSRRGRGRAVVRS